MRRSLTFALILVTLAFWSMSIWTLSGKLAEDALLWAAAPSIVGLALLLVLFAAKRIFSYNDAVRRRFSTVLALTLLVVIVCVYADAFALNGMIFERGLEIWRLELFVDERLPLTLAFAGAVCHPILFCIAAIALLALPAPKNDFFRNMH